VIFEARPDAVVQIASLAIRSGNGAMLKGGSEARCTNEAVMEALKLGLDRSAVSADALTLLTTRQESLALLRLDGLVDLIIPRGSNELVRFIQDNTRIPVLGHADGICHLYVDAAAEVEQAVRIAIDSKTQYPAACNAIETLLVHESIASAFLASAVPAFQAAGVILRGDERSRELGISDAVVPIGQAKELNTALQLLLEALLTGVALHASEDRAAAPQTQRPGQFRHAGAGGPSDGGGHLRA